MNEAQSHHPKGYLTTEELTALGRVKDPAVITALLELCTPPETKTDPAANEWMAEQIRNIELNHAHAGETYLALQEFLDAAYPGQHQRLPEQMFQPYFITPNMPASCPVHPAHLTTPPPELGLYEPNDVRSRLRGEAPPRLWNQQRLDQQRDFFRAEAARIRAGHNQSLG